MPRPWSPCVCSPRRHRQRLQHRRWHRPPAPATSAPPKRTPEETAERVRAAAERDGQAHFEAVQRRRERGRRARAEFRRRWLAAFTKLVPLAIDADKLIRAEMPEMTAMRLREVLGAWMYSVACLRAVAAGVERINLDGTPAGVADEEQRARALEELKMRGKWPMDGVPWRQSGSLATT